MYKLTQAPWMYEIMLEVQNGSSHKLFKPCLILLGIVCCFTLIILPYWGKAIIPARFVCGILALGLLCLSGQLRAQLFRNPVFYAMAAYALACVASVLANGLRFSLAGTGLAWFCVFLAFWCLGSVLRDFARLPFVLLGLAAITLLCGYVLLAREGLGLIDASAWQTAGDRLVGPFKAQGNRLAVLLTSSAFLCLSGGFAVTEKRLRIILWSIAALSAFFLLNAGTRTWTTFFFGTAALYLAAQKVPWRILALTGTALLVVFALLYIMDASQLKNYFNVGQGGRLSVLSRIPMWQLAWELFTQHPILGVGPEQFRELYKLHYDANLAHLPTTEHFFAVAKTTHAHNIIISPMVETGLVGAVSFFAALFLSIRSGLKRQGLQRDAAVFLVLSFFVGMLNPPLDRESGTVLAAMIGLAAALPGIKNRLSA